MKFHFFKYNFFRQFMFYGMIFIFGLISTDDEHQSVPVLIISGCIAAVFLLALIYQYLSYLVIDKEGIVYHSLLKRYRLNWDEIGQVKVIKRWDKNLGFRWIIILKSDDPKDLNKKKNSFNRKGECITCAYSKRTFNELKKYWKDKDTITDSINSMMDELKAHGH